jgi:DNA polymerase I-like protein with 3'-5' exonuclease and polymerase domains
LADYQSIKVKALGVYLPLLADGIEQPIHCSVDPVLVSGRSSTFEPNMQNLPRAGGFRECFVPRAGRVFCGADFDGAELRSLAQTTYLLCGERSRLAALFRSDPHADPHLAFAAESLLGITLDEAVARKRKKDPAVADARQRAKAANFGFPGMMGARRFAANSEKTFWESGGKGAIFSDREASELRARYLRQWPEQQVYFAQVAARCAGGAGTFRVPVVGGWRGGCGASDGANNAFQGLTAYGAKRALYEVCRACYVTAASPLYGGRPVLFVHDEAIIEVSEESAHDAASELEKIMVTSFQSVHPDIPVGASAVLMRRWYKGAEPVFDTEGRRTFWEPEKEKK